MMVTNGTLTAANYSFAFVDGTLTVTAATLTVTADNKSKVYGDANPSLTARCWTSSVGDRVMIDSAVRTPTLPACCA